MTPSSSSGTNQDNQQKIINDLRKLTNPCGCSDIFELAGQLGSLLSEVNDRIPAWMSTNIAQDVCDSMMKLVVELAEFSDILGRTPNNNLDQVKDSLYADFCEGALLETTIKSFSESVKTILEDLVRTEQQGLVQLLDLSLAHLEKRLVATHGELSFMKQAISDQVYDSDPVMNLAFPSKIAKVYEDLEKFLEKHLARLKNGEPVQHTFQLGPDIELPSDERLISLLAPPEEYTHDFGYFIFKREAIDEELLTARVKSNLSLAEKLLSVMLDNLSLQQNWNKYSVSLGKKTNGAARWICDQYGIMFVTPDAEGLIKSHINELRQGRSPGLALPREEQATAKNGFQTRKIIVKYNPDDNEVEGKPTQKRAGSVPSTSTPLIIEIQYRTPEENKDAERHPDRAHDVYKTRLRNRLEEVKHKAPVIEFVAHLIDWAVRGADGEPPKGIKGYSCILVD